MAIPQSRTIKRNYSNIFQLTVVCIAAVKLMIISIYIVYNVHVHNGNTNSTSYIHVGITKSQEI